MAWLELTGGGRKARLTEEGRAVVERAKAAYAEGDSVEEIADREGLPSSRHLQFLLAVEGEVPGP